MPNNTSRRQNNGGSRRNGNGNGNARAPRIMNPLGSHAALRGAFRQNLTVVKRKVWAARQETLVMTPSTSTLQTYGPVGTPFANNTLYYRLDDFYTGTDTPLDQFDQFRFAKITVFGLNQSEQSLCELTVFTSVDLDDRAPVSWQEIRRRQNVSISMIRPNNPGQVVAEWKPRANFPSSGGASAADNLVPNGNVWFDTTAVSQEFVGVKVHVVGNTTFSAPTGSRPNVVSFLAVAEIEFRGKI